MDQPALVLSIATINAWNRLMAATRQIGGGWIEQMLTGQAGHPAPTQ